MAKIIRKTVVLTPILYERIKKHGQRTGCFSFSEAVRDVARIAFGMKPRKTRQLNRRQRR